MPGTPAGFPEPNFSTGPVGTAASAVRPSNAQPGRSKLSSAALNFALRARGLRSLSSSVAVTGFLVSTRKCLSLIRALAEGILYDAIFQRVKTDHHHASSWLQNPRRRFQQRLQIFQFAVYEDSKSLKGL